MSRLDQFESVFKAASKQVFQYKPITFAKVLVITDLSDYEASLFGDRVQEFLALDAEWTVLAGDAAPDVGAVLAAVETHRPDLVCTYRNLHSNAWRWPYTLGDHVEVLTQTTDIPVLVLPRVDHGAWTNSITDTDTVMAITDHLTGDDRLVNVAAALTHAGGTLHLAHVEDERAFNHFIDVISKLPFIPTDEARDGIHHRLLQEPTDYIRTCREALVAAEVKLTLKEIVRVGHHLNEFKQLIKEHSVDLLVMNSKDESQRAMHGLAYPLAVELRATPLLML